MPSFIANGRLVDAVAVGDAGLNRGPEAMKELDNEYPTPEQIEEMFLAYQQDGKDGISRVLRKRVQEREAARKRDQSSATDQ